MKVHINHFTTLVYRSPQVMLPSVHLNGTAHRARCNGEDFTNEAGITVSTMPEVALALGVDIPGDPALSCSLIFKNALQCPYLLPCQRFDIGRQHALW